MIKQIRLLTALELKNLFGFNVRRYTKDTKAIRRSNLVIGCVIFALIILIGYVAGFSAGLAMLGMRELIPAYLVVISSLIIFFFGLFKAGPTIFSQKCYDIVCSLPVSQTAIVVSRFLQMYVCDLAMTALVVVPGSIVYAIFAKPAFGFYITTLIGIILVPVIPLALSTLVGTAIAAASSRMKNKTAAVTILTVVFIVAVLGLSFSSSTIAEEITPEMLMQLADTVSELIGKIYPPAMWLGNAIVAGNFMGLVWFVLLSAAAFTVILVAVCRSFHAVCRRLFATSARHDYKMQILRERSVRKALYIRELKRYFASSIYVTNTIIGPIMGTILAVAILVFRNDIFSLSLPIDIDIPSLLPIFVAAAMTMMPPSSVSISMEGKHFWLVKSLPLSTKDILDSKILVTLSLIAPFYLVSEVILAIALKPSFADFIFMVLLPAAIICFIVVWSITGNLIFHSFDWDKEETVVKQSAAAAVGGFAGILVAIVCAVAIIVVPAQLAAAFKVVLLVLLVVGTFLLYRTNNKKQLNTL